MTPRSTVGANAIADYIARHSLGAERCAQCQIVRSPEEFLEWRKWSNKPPTHLVRPRPMCRLCESRRKTLADANRRKRINLATAGTDLLEAAEYALYPGVSYHRMTRLQRLHCYWVARRWWHNTNCWVAMSGFSLENDMDRLATLADWLVAQGCTTDPLPSPPVPYVHDYAEDYRRAVDRAHQWRGDRAGGDVQTEEDAADAEFARTRSRRSRGAAALHRALAGVAAIGRASTDAEDFYALVGAVARDLASGGSGAGLE